MTAFQRYCVAALLAAGVGWTGCDRPEAPATGRPWVEFLGDLSDLDRFARLDTVTSHLRSTFDRQGGNNDYNYFLAPGAQTGWYVIADLKGPGVVRRFWTTGMDRGHRFKFYFDGEKKPRLSGKVEDLFGEQFPFVPPLARYLNYCWFSYVPLTYARSLRVEMQAPTEKPGGPSRLYYHLNYETYAEGTALQTFPRELDATQRAALEQARVAWDQAMRPVPPPADLANSQRIEPGARGRLWQAEGEGVLRSWWLRVEPADPAAWTTSAREALLQDALLEVKYDGLDAASISVPLGDFFLNGWRSRDLSTLPLASQDPCYHGRLPLPYAKGIAFEIVNQADHPIHVGFTPGPIEPRHPAHGYLHAVWQRSGPQAGQPHGILNVLGRGKYVGTFLGVTGLGKDWWVLEGDERFWVDGETQPSRHGTGLEDYFNGGWYYRGGALAPLSGALDHAPFRVAQYRFHGPDPIHFDRSLRVTIERGDQNVSPAYFQSMAWFYLDAPQAFPGATNRAERTAVAHPQFRPTLMLQLDELERLNNFRAARNLVREYRERYPGQPEDGVLRLRELEYGRWLGASVQASDYEPFLRGDFGPAAAEQAKTLAWFYAQPNRALVAMNANGAGTLYLDGQRILEGDQPYGLFVTGVELTEGPHTLAADVSIRRAEPWVKFAVRTHTGVTGSGLSTLFSTEAPAGWKEREGSLAGGQRIGPNHLVRGTPDAPYLGGEANAFVLLSSKAYALRGHEWGYAYRGPARYRLDFTLPLAGEPDWMPAATGLPR
jgi:hypothetical protein